MPFEQRIPHPLTISSVRAYASADPGVYGLSNSQQWIYIGQADNIRDALLDHLRAQDTAVLRELPTGFVFETCSGDHRVVRQTSLIHEYAPACNGNAARRNESALRKRLNATQ
jgi:excinuclease UvrABC nuclease subunit